MSTTDTGAHRVRWIAISPDGYKQPRAAWMTDRSSGYGWDAVCSCGWESRTGGALASCVRRAIVEHKELAWLDALTPEQVRAWALGAVSA